MVFYFYPQCAEPADHKWVIYMGKDKVENEDLIRFGLQEDVWCALSASTGAQSEHACRCTAPPASDPCRLLLDLKHRLAVFRTSHLTPDFHAS